MRIVKIILKSIFVFFFGFLGSVCGKNGGSYFWNKGLKGFFLVKVFCGIEFICF